MVTKRLLRRERLRENGFTSGISIMREYVHKCGRKRRQPS